MKKFFYIAEMMNVEGKGFAYDMIKRCESYDEAKGFCKAAVKEWTDSGLEAQMKWVDGVVYGAQALDSEFVVRHDYMIFESPCFMAGGAEGL